MSSPGDSTKPREGAEGDRSSVSSSTSLPPDKRGGVKTVPTPPDGGWGWVVVFGSFMVHIIADGCSFSFGVFYVELLDYFKESKAKTAWVGALFVSVPLIAGPIASALTNRYGCRVVTISGSIMATFGFLLSMAAPSVEILCVTFGIISGLGLAMVYVPAVVVVAFYFEKRRALATGLAVSGSGIVTFVFAPLTEYLIDQYGWRGTLLIQAGLLLNICVCGACFRPLEAPKEGKQERKELLRSYEDISKKESPAQSTLSLDEKGKSAPKAHPIDQNNFDEAKTMLLGESTSKSMTTIPTYLSKTESNAHSEDTHNLQEGGVEEKLITGEETQGKGSAQERNLTEAKQGQNVPNTREMFMAALSKRDLNYRGSLIQIGTCNIGNRTKSCPTLNEYHDCENKPDVEGGVHEGRVANFSKKVSSALKDMLDVSVLKNTNFLLFGISNLILYMWYDVPYMFLTDRAIYLGISEESASFLVSILGIVNMVGQVIYGFIGDLPQVNPTLLYLVSITIAGIATMVMPLFTSYASMAIYSTVFGFVISANFTLTTIILVELISVEKLTYAYGVIMFGMGVANAIGPPFAGK